MNLLKSFRHASSDEEIETAMASREDGDSVGVLGASRTDKSCSRVMVENSQHNVVSGKPIVSTAVDGHRGEVL